MNMKIPYNKIFIKQKVEAIEIFTNFETKNRYRIIDESGNDLFFAFEESNFISRQFLKVMRPLKLHIIDNTKNPQLTIERPFAFFLAKHTVKSPSGQTLGYIKQKFAFFKAIFDIYDAGGQLIFQCISKFPHYWTFNILQNEQQVAVVTKKWSGFGKEIFTDADTFMVDFGSISDNNRKLLILATAFAIDLRVFER